MPTEKRENPTEGTGLLGGVSSSPRSPRDSLRSASLHHGCCCCAREDAVHREKNLRPGHRPILRSPPFSSQPARFLPLRLSPPLPLLLCSRSAATLLASLLSFCTSFSQLSRYGLATPSSHDGCCAGAPICRQPVLRTLCFTKLAASSPRSFRWTPKYMG